jgi:CheY-like chemotaxis protein
MKHSFAGPNGEYGQGGSGQIGVSLSEDNVLVGKRVLLVEDEALVAMLVEDMLADEGCEVAATASRLGEAVAAAKDLSIAMDLAILDVNLAGEPVFAVAEALAERGVPFAFATGYGAGGLPDAWKTRPTLQKPFTAADVRTVLIKVATGN